MLEVQREQHATCHDCADKTEAIACRQDRLIGALIGLAHAVVGNEELVNAQTYSLIRNVLTATASADTLTHAVSAHLMDRIAREKHRLVPRCSSCDHPCGRNDDYDMSLMWHAIEEIRSLKTRLLLDIRAMAVLATQTAAHCHTDADADAFILHALDVLGNEWDAESLQFIVMKADEAKQRSTELLNRLTS